MELGKYKLAMRPKKYLTREFVVYKEAPEAMDDVITEEQNTIDTMPSQAPAMDNYMPEIPGMEDPSLRQVELADGGVVQREGFAEKGFVKLGRQPDPESMVGQIRTYLEKNYKKGDKVDVNQIVKLFNYDASRTNKTVRQLGLVPMNNEDKIAIKVQNFIDNYIKENNALPEQKIVKEGTKTDAQVIRRLLNKGRIQNIQLTRFEVNEQVAKYILNTEKPTVKGIKKILGTYEKDPSKVLTRIYVNSLNSLTNKLNKVDEGRSVFANFNVDEIEKLKYKVRQIPGFTSYYEREITDLIADAYKDQPEKKSKALKKIAKFKSFNNDGSNKYHYYIPNVIVDFAKKEQILICSSLNSTRCLYSKYDISPQGV